MLNKKKKIFCIGLNKTGTTTIEKVLADFNYKLGNQTKGELLITNWYKRDFRAIIKHCKTANAFQDVPFSLPYTFIALDQYFANAKFILTIRDNPEEWYKSLTAFHSRLWGNGVDLLTIKELKEVDYRYKNYAYKAHKAIFNTPDNDLYNKEILFNYYKNHLQSVTEYFRSQPEKLIVLNVSVKNDYNKLCQFLNKSPLYDTFPWENKTAKD